MYVVAANTRPSPEVPETSKPTLSSLHPIYSATGKSQLLLFSILSHSRHLPVPLLFFPVPPRNCKQADCSGNFGSLNILVSHVHYITCHTFCLPTNLFCLFILQVFQMSKYTTDFSKSAFNFAKLFLAHSLYWPN